MSVVNLLHVCMNSSWSEQSLLAALLTLPQDSPLLASRQGGWLACLFTIKCRRQVLQGQRRGQQEDE